MRKSLYERKSISLAVALIVSSGYAGLSSAQSDAALEEIVVTAQKRAENIQETPISITALSGSAIEKRGITNSGDLMGEIPGVAGFEAPGSRGTTGLTIRGMASGGPNNLSLDPAIGIYLDGVFIGKNVGSALDVAELERIEVLRGPQGTLYGRNSTGGAVNFISRKPTGEFGLRATGAVGNYDYRSLKLNVDLPAIGEVGSGLGQIAFSVGYQTRLRDGFQENDSPGGADFNDLDRQAWRLAAKWDLTEHFSADYIYDHSALDESNALEQVVGFNPVDAAGLVDRVSALQGILLGARAWAATPGTDPRISERWIPSLEQTIASYQGALAQGPGRQNRGFADFSPFTDTETDGHALTLTWNIGDLSLKSITAYREMESYVFGDIENIDSRLDGNGAGAYNDLLHLTLGGLYGATGGFDPGIPQLPFDAIWAGVDDIGAFHTKQDTDNFYDQFSQEFQLVGSSESLDYVLGLYYFEDDAKYSRRAIFVAPLSGAPTQNYALSTEATAVYGQVTWQPGWLDNRVSLTLGLRYTEEDKDIVWDYLAYSTPFAGELPRQTLANAERFDNVSGNFTAAFQATPDINTFLRYATGYRSGGFNGEQIATPAFNEETVEQWEIGVKSDWWDGRLRLNGSLYTYVWEDIQLANTDSSDGSATTRIINAGEADRWGAELEMLVAPLDRLVLGVSYAYIHGDFDKFPDVCGTAVPQTCIDGVSSAVRPYSPSNQLSLTADYTFAETALGDVTGFLRVNWQDEWYENALWNGVVDGQPVAYPSAVMDERTVVGARVSLENIQVGDAMMRVTLFGDNLTDDDYPVYAINFGALGLITEQYGAPRTWGLELSYDY
ncbi:MAG: TonB-dependent receptor [Haliea sp.]|uniref:TonB-dependent receptor n=1 Tax=Haliea sp. TaxID=1932666 RepID=UPI000C61F570|nr:TonB-dependent receptor [Haliea sp.]MBM68918.1 TonB-dependent receptor [Haliea sp.]|tara:strand:+ start:12416 stop:14938 length:2523 start_codon:yes stop_codon:yes gene_type:complete